MENFNIKICDEKFKLIHTANQNNLPHCGREKANRRHL